MERYVATLACLEAEHAARNKAVLRAVQGIEAAHVLPTHQPDARPS